MNISNLLALCRGPGYLGVRQTLRFCSDFVHQPQQPFQKQGSYEGPGKTTVAILNEDSMGINMIDSYSRDGFRLNDDTKILGPCVIFPTAVLGEDKKAVGNCLTNILFHLKTEIKKLTKCP